MGGRQPAVRARAASGAGVMQAGTGHPACDVSVIRPSAEDAYEVRPTNYSAATPGTALVVSRFFQHR